MKAQKSRLYNDVEFLTEIRPYRNHLNLVTLSRVVEYIKREFQKAGLVVEEQKWIAGGNEYTNVIGLYNPNQEKTLVVGAHYDVCGDQPGADDNASAVAGLLETARLLGEHKPELDYTIELVAYCLEEPPYFATELMGSYIHAKSLYDKQVNVIGMVCYEMIGYFSDEPGSQRFPAFELADLLPSVGNFILTIGGKQNEKFSRKFRDLMAVLSNVEVFNISFPEESPFFELACLSDHSNYWKFGFDAFMINDTSFLRNPNYHRDTDTIDTLDFDKMREVVSGAYYAIVHQ